MWLYEGERDDHPHGATHRAHYATLNASAPTAHLHSSMIILVLAAVMHPPAMIDKHDSPSTHPTPD